MSKFLDLTGLTYFYQKLKDKFALKSQQLPTIANKTLNTTTGSMNLTSVDLNTVVTSGFYFATNCTNSKYTAATLVVIGYSGTTSCTQIESNITTNELAMRTLYNGTWSDWEVISTTILGATYSPSTKTVTLSGIEDLGDADTTSY